jgi:hypothetical protein
MGAPEPRGVSKLDFEYAKMRKCRTLHRLLEEKYKGCRILMGEYDNFAKGNILEQRFYYRYSLALKFIKLQKSNR